MGQVRSLQNDQHDFVARTFFTNRTVLAPYVGSALCVHCFGDRMVSITPFTAPAVSRGETIRFGSLEFPTIPHDGLWAPPPFPPSQTFQFGSLEFVTDQLGALLLHEEEAALADTEEPSAPTKPRDLRRR